MAPARRLNLDARALRSGTTPLGGRMKVIRLLAAAAIALTATTAMAQGGPPPGGGQGGGQRGNQMARLMEGITLSADQQAKVDSIVAASRAESMKMREEMQA